MVTHMIISNSKLTLPAVSMQSIALPVHIGISIFSKIAIKSNKTEKKKVTL